MSTTTKIYKETIREDLRRALVAVVNRELGATERLDMALVPIVLSNVLSAPPTFEEGCLLGYRSRDAEVAKKDAEIAELQAEKAELVEALTVMVEAEERCPFTSVDLGGAAEHAREVLAKHEEAQ